MYEASLHAVTERWKEAFGQYDELRAEAEAAVARWEWATGERYSLLPFYFKRFPGRGRALKAPPTPGGYYITYGFDRQNRPRLHRLHGYYASDDAFDSFYVYADSVVEIIEFSVPPRIPLRVQHIFYEAGRVVRYASFRLNGYAPLYSQKAENPDALYAWLGSNGRRSQIEQYIYSGSRLTNILLYGESAGAPHWQAEEHFTYDQDGKLVRIERVYDGGMSQVLYRKREKGETFKSIRQAATRAMVAAIVERLKMEHIKDKLCWIELSYQSTLHHFPPLIILGHDSDRQSLLESGSTDARHFAFAPALAARAHFLELTDPATLEVCQHLEQEIQVGQKWDIATDILREVAAELTRHD